MLRDQVGGGGDEIEKTKAAPELDADGGERRNV